MRRPLLPLLFTSLLSLLAVITSGAVDNIKYQPIAAQGFHCDVGGASCSGGWSYAVSRAGVATTVPNPFFRIKNNSTVDAVFEATVGDDGASSESPVVLEFSYALLDGDASGALLASFLHSRAAGSSSETTFSVTCDGDVLHEAEAPKGRGVLVQSAPIDCPALSTVRLQITLPSAGSVSVDDVYLWRERSELQVISLRSGPSCTASGYAEVSSFDVCEAAAIDLKLGPEATLRTDAITAALIFPGFPSLVPGEPPLLKAFAQLGYPIVTRPVNCYLSEWDGLQTTEVAAVEQGLDLRINPECDNDTYLPCIEENVCFGPCTEESFGDAPGVWFNSQAAEYLKNNGVLDTEGFNETEAALIEQQAKSDLDGLNEAGCDGNPDYSCVCVDTYVPPVPSKRGCTCLDAFTYEGRGYTGCSAVDSPRTGLYQGRTFCAVVPGSCPEPLECGGDLGGKLQPSACWDECSKPDVKVCTTVECLSIADFGEVKLVFVGQNVLFTLLYLALSLRILWLERAQQGAVVKDSNRHRILQLVLAGCVVRLVYVDISDLVVGMPAAVEFIMAAVKEVLFVSAMALLLFYWKEIQVSMQRKSTKTVDKLRPQLMVCVGSFTAVRTVQVICECVGDKVAAQVFKGFVGVAILAIVVFGAAWGVRLRRRLASMSSASLANARAIRRLTSFLAIEAVLVFILVIMFAVTELTIKPEEQIATNPAGLLTIIVVQRSTEFLMMATLVHVCSVKPAPRKKPFKPDGDASSSATGEISEMATLAATLVTSVANSRLANTFREHYHPSGRDNPKQTANGHTSVPSDSSIKSAASSTSSANGGEQHFKGNPSSPRGGGHNAEPDVESPQPTANIGVRHSSLLAAPPPRVPPTFAGHDEV